MPTWTPSAPFVPPRGLSDPHAQTVLASFIRRPRVGPLRRERWETPDGDFVDLDFVDGPKNAPCVIVLHGLEGSTQSGYVLEVLKGAKARGWRAAALNFRSCSGELNRKLHSYSSGDTTDAKYVIERLAGQGPLFAVGFSLGGNVLLKSLAELGADAKVAGAAAVGVPFDLAACARMIDSATPMRFIYRNVFVRSLKRKALVKAERFPGRVDVDALKRARKLSKFDDVFTAPVNGYQNSAEYYARAASNPVLHQIRVPTLLISAKDDPIAPLPEFTKEARDNPALHFLISERGGHVGFIDGSLLKPGYWAEREALHFFDTRLEQHA